MRAAAVALRLGAAARLHLTAVKGALCPSETRGCHGDATRSPKPQPLRGLLGPGQPAGPCSRVWECVGKPGAGAWKGAGACDGERFHTGALEPADSGS